MSEKISPAISLSNSMYYALHDKHDEKKYTTWGGKAITMLSNCCTILIGTIETLVRLILGIIGIITYSPFMLFDIEFEDGSLLKTIGDFIGENLVGGAVYSYMSVADSFISLFSKD